jgi:DNA-binding MarR family transcriptional regulator
VDLARSLGVTPSATTTLCDRLVAKGLLSRRGGTDRRSIALTITRLGLEQLEIIAARRGAQLREIFFRLPSAVQASLAEALPAFLDAAGDLEIDESSANGPVSERVAAEGVH